jgi:2-oxoglutarate ferredoxin oxidoreductase subunit gamma
MLGAVVRLTGLVKPESILDVLKKRIPSNFLDINEEALKLGMTLVEEDPACRGLTDVT